MSRRELRASPPDALWARIDAECKRVGIRPAALVLLSLDAHLPQPAPELAPKPLSVREQKAAEAERIAALKAKPNCVVWNERIFTRGLKSEAWFERECHHASKTLETIYRNSGKPPPQMWFGRLIGRADEQGVDVWALLEKGEAVKFEPVVHGYLLLPPPTDEQLYAHTGAA